MVKSLDAWIFLYLICNSCQAQLTSDFLSKKHCFNKKLCLGANRLLGFSTDLVNRLCRCDKECEVSNDCCFKNTNTRNPLMCTTPPGKSFSMYMISSCPSDVQKQKIKKLCEDEPINFVISLQVIPVISATRRIVYKNIFCARCNNEIHVKPWKTEIKCSKKMPEISFLKTSKIFQKIYFNPKTNNIELPLLSANKKDKCVLITQPFPDKIRLCLPHISDCHPTWADDQIRRKCESFTSYIYGRITNGKWNIYKNYYCATCNFVQFFRCADTWEEKQHVVKRSFSDVLHAGEEQKAKDTPDESSNKNNKQTPADSQTVPLQNPCPPKHKFDKLSKTCLHQETNCDRLKAC